MWSCQDDIELVAAIPKNAHRYEIYRVNVRSGGVRHPSCRWRPFEEKVDKHGDVNARNSLNKVSTDNFQSMKQLTKLPFDP